MVRLFRPLVLPVLAASAVSSCAWLTEDDPPPENPNAPKLVGRVASVSPDRGFVLIESYGKWTVEAGTILTVQGPGGRNANLVTTGEHSRHHAAADVQSGSFEIGDAVFARPSPQKADISPNPPKNSSDNPDKNTKESSNQGGISRD